MIKVLPWIAAGLFTMCICIEEKMKRTGKKMSPEYQVLSWIPILALFTMAFIAWYTGHKTDGTLKIAISLICGIIHIVNIQMINSAEIESDFN